MLHRQPHAFQVDRDDAVEVVFLERRDRRRRAFDAGTVEGAVDAPEAGDDIGDERLDTCRLCHIACRRVRFAAGVPHQARGFLGAGRVEVGAEHAGAGTRGGQRGGAPDAAGRAGDQHHS